MEREVRLEVKTDRRVPIEVGSTPQSTEGERERGIEIETAAETAFVIILCIDFAESKKKTTPPTLLLQIAIAFPLLDWDPMQTLINNRLHNNSCLVCIR